MLDPEQAEMVQNVFRLSNKHVRDVMVPRDKMASLELMTPSDKVLEAMRSGAHTRMPVYDREPDNIVGVVNTKNLFYLFSLHGVVILEDAIYPALFLKPNEEIANALRLFRKAKRPMALVRDEEGKIHGLITLEDILEEIVGDIEDEHDQPVPRMPAFAVAAIGGPCQWWRRRSDRNPLFSVAFPARAPRRPLARGDGYAPESIPAAAAALGPRQLRDRLCRGPRR